MVYFSQIVISQILWAVDEADVKETIETSINKYKSKNTGRGAENYIMNIVMELQYLKTKKELAPKVLENITIAIDILRRVNRQGQRYFL
jgi:hypothetical protein